MKKALLGKLVSNNSYIKHYYSLIKRLGSDYSLLLCEFINKFDYYRQNNQLVQEEWFFYKRDDIEKKFGFSEFKQRTIINKLEKEGLIKTTFFKGEMPPKRYYSIEIDKVLKLFLEEKIE